MSARARLIVLVAGAAAAAVAVVVGVAAFSGEEREQTAAPPPPRQGSPPLALELGLRTDAEAVALRRAIGLYERGRRAAAGRIFARFDSPEARIGAAFAAWPAGTLERLEQLGNLHPRDAAVQLNLGLARFWARRGDARTPWLRAEVLRPDSAYAVAAGNLLHPELARDLPVFVPGFSAPASLFRLGAARQLDTLRRLAARGDRRGRLLYGVALQRLGRQLSARRVFDAAAQAAPRDAEAQVAAAVVRYDKDDPSQAFSRLGPLVRRFPRAATVRFHLGLLLLWSAQVTEAKRQLRLAVQDGGPLAVEARRYLERLANVGTR